jgi:hypothetical protein
MNLKRGDDVSEPLSRRDLFKGAVIMGAVATLPAGSSAWELEVPEAIFERDATFTFPPSEGSYRWEWRVHCPGESKVLCGGVARPEETLSLPIAYPYSQKTVHGEYRYQLRFGGESLEEQKSVFIHVSLSPYRFGC